MSDFETSSDAYRPSAETPADSAPPQDASQASPQKRPRVWTVFLVVVTALVLAVVVQAVFGIALAVSAIADGVDPKQLQKVLIPTLMSPPVFIGMLVLGQLSMLAVALIAARLSPVPSVERLGLGRPRCPTWAHGVFVLGSALPLALGVGAAYLMTLVVDPDESVKMLYEQMTKVWAIPFIVAIGLFPGVCEEIMFRGYVQRRFVERWGPWPGIIATSIIFGLFHITPHAIALATIIGFWLGVIAYRTGSIWSGALCHGCINSGWNVWQVGKQVWGFPATISPVVAAIGIVVIVLLTALAIRVLAKSITEPTEVSTSQP